MTSSNGLSLTLWILTTSSRKVKTNLFKEESLRKLAAEAGSSSKRNSQTSIWIEASYQCKTFR